MSPATPAPPILVCCQVILGVWQDEDIHIDLAHLAQFAGARLIVAHCTGIDADGKTLLFNERPPLHFDLLSINIGGQPDLEAIEGLKIIPFQLSRSLIFKHRLRCC